MRPCPSATAQTRLQRKEQQTRNPGYARENADEHCSLPGNVLSAVQRPAQIERKRTVREIAGYQQRSSPAGEKQAHPSLPEQNLGEEAAIDAQDRLGPHAQN